MCCVETPPQVKRLEYPRQTYAATSYKNISNPEQINKHKLTTMSTQSNSNVDHSKSTLVNHFKSMSCDDRSERAKLDDEQANDNINSILNHIGVILVVSLCSILAAACIALAVFLLKSFVNVLFF